MTTTTIKITDISCFDYYGRGQVTFDVDGEEVKVEAAYSDDSRFEPTEYTQVLNRHIVRLVNMDGDDGFYNFCGERDIDELTPEEIKQFESEYVAYCIDFINENVDLQEEMPELYYYLEVSVKSPFELI